MCIRDSQYSITAIGTIMVQSALNSLGSTLVAAFTAASKIEQVVTQAYVALGTAMATFCAQNKMCIRDSSCTTDNEDSDNFFHQ